MPESHLTKRALSDALKALMRKEPFAKITVADICEQCGMNRKSFYYHFADKYELMNWIFDMDVLDLITHRKDEQSMEKMAVLCHTLYENREFYRNALNVQGQNSLRDHIREIARPIFRARVAEVLAGEEDIDFYTEIFLDAILGAMLRWIMKRDCVTPEEFVSDFFSCLISTGKYISDKYIKS